MRLRQIELAELEDDERLYQLHCELAEHGWCKASEHGLFETFATACSCLRRGREPAALFVWLVNHGKEERAIQPEDEDEASRRLMGLRRLGGKRMEKTVRLGDMLPKVTRRRPA